MGCWGKGSLWDVVAVAYYGMPYYGMHFMGWTCVNFRPAIRFLILRTVSPLVKDSSEFKGLLPWSSTPAHDPVMGESPFSRKVWGVGEAEVISQDSLCLWVSSYTCLFPGFLESRIFTNIITRLRESAEVEALVLHMARYHIRSPKHF